MENTLKKSKPSSELIYHLIHTSKVPNKKQKVGKTELNYDTDDINFGKTGESFVFKESKSKSCKELIKSLTPAYNSSESDHDFDKTFQPLIIDSNMFLGVTW